MLVGFCLLTLGTLLFMFEVTGIFLALVGLVYFRHRDRVEPYAWSAYGRAHASGARMSNCFHSCIALSKIDGVIPATLWFSGWRSHGA